MIDPAIHIVIVLAFATLFALAGIHKLRAPAIFVATLGEYRLVPRPFVATVALIVMCLEFAVVLGIIWPTTRGPVALIGAGLLLVYGAAIGINILRGRYELDCGCTLQHRRVGPWMVARNALLALMLLVLIAPVSPRSLELTDVLTIVAALAVSILLYASAELLLGQTKSTSSLEHQ